MQQAHIHHEGKIHTLPLPTINIRQFLLPQTQTHRQNPPAPLLPPAMPLAPNLQPRQELPNILLHPHILESTPFRTHRKNTHPCPHLNPNMKTNIKICNNRNHRL